MKTQELKSQVWFILLAIILINLHFIIFAEASTGTYRADVVTDVYINKVGVNENPKNNFELDNYSEVNVQVEFNLKDKRVRSGDYFEIILPDELSVEGILKDNDRFNFDVKNSSQVSIATGQVRRENHQNRMRITFNHNASTQSIDNGKAFVKATVKAQPGTSSGLKNIELKYQVLYGQAFTQSVSLKIGVLNIDEVFYDLPMSGQASQTDDSVLWAIRVNYAKRDLRNVVITLKIQGAKFKGYSSTDSIEAHAIDYNAAGEQLWDNSTRIPIPENNISISADGLTMTIRAGASFTNKRGIILYKTAYPKSHSIVYSASFEATGVRVNQEPRVYRLLEGGGSAETRPYGSLLIENIDDKQKLIKGGSFRINKGNSTIHTISDSEGIILIENLHPGDYIIEQLDTPSSYILDNTSRRKNVTVKGTSVSTEVKFINPRKKGKIRITNRDTNGMFVSGARFRLVEKSSGIINQENIQVTEVNGKLLENIPYGTYEIKMSTVANGFQADTTQITVVVNDEITPVEANFVSRREVGSIEVKSIDKESARLIEGVEYELLLKNTMIPYSNISFIKQSNGNLLASDVPTGNYIIRQKTYPAAYKQVGGQTIEVLSNQKTDVTFENELKKGTLKIAVKNQKGEPLNAFVDIMENGEKVRENILVNNGEVIIPLPIGEYTVTQKAVEGYQLPASQNIRIDDNRKIEVNFVNQLKPDRIRIILVGKEKESDIQKEALQNIELQIAGDNNFSKIIRTEADGVTTIEIEPGNYTITQISEHAHYDKSQPKPLTVEGGGKERIIEIANIRKKENLTIILQDENQNPITGARFEIFRVNESGGRLEEISAGDGETNTEGKIIKNLPYGKYIIRQTSTLDKYEKSNEKSITLDANNKEVTFTNKLKKGNLTIVLQDENQNPITGARFEIFKVNEIGGRLEEISAGDGETNTEGKIIKNLPYGKYIVRQTSTLDKYEKLNEKGITLDANNKEVTFTNMLKQVNLKITVKNQKGEPLNAFVDIMENGEKVRENILVNNGEVIIPLPIGEYTVTQKAVEGYQLPASQNIRIDDNRKIEVNFVNQLKPDRIRIILVGKEKESDIQKEALQNIELQIAGDNNFSKIIRTEADGAATIEIEAGNYTITQISEHAHYDKSQQKPLTVEGGGKERIIEIINIRKKENLTITLQDENQNPIAGARFEIFRVNESGGRLEEISAGIETTNTEGKIIKNLPYGKYIIRQTSTPDNYKMTTDDREVSIDNNNPNPSEEFVNEKQSLSGEGAGGSTPGGNSSTNDGTGNQNGGTSGGNTSTNDGTGNQNGGATGGNTSTNDNTGNQNTGTTEGNDSATGDAPGQGGQESGNTGTNNDSKPNGSESQTAADSSASQKQGNQYESTGESGGYNPPSSVRPDPYLPDDSELNKSEEPNKNEDVKDEESLETGIVENVEDEFENEISASDVSDEKISLSNREDSESQEENAAEKSSQSSIINKSKIPLIMPSALPKTGVIPFEKILSPEFMWKFFAIGFLMLGMAELYLRRKNRN